jgi:hypothetical protein
MAGDSLCDKETLILSINKLQEMRKLLSILLLGIQATAIACSSMWAQTVVQRQPLERKLGEYKVSANYQPRVRGYDPKTGAPITYDHKPRVEVLDARARKYALKWIGFDGQEKSAVFQSGDAVDVMVDASVSRTPTGQYLYTYEIKNLPSSGASLKRFIVQNLAAVVTPEKDGKLMPFSMSKEIPTFSEGNWLAFADVSDEVRVDPGQVVMVHLTSPAPPGLVRCLASAETVVEGADEDTPLDLDSLLVGFNEYPHGYTIGPVESLTSLSESERAKYLFDNLPHFRKAGWITDETLGRYQQSLKNGDLKAVSKQAEQDLKADQITREVFAIIEALR